MSELAAFTFLLLSLSTPSSQLCCFVVSFYISKAFWQGQFDYPMNAPLAVPKVKCQAFFSTQIGKPLFLLPVLQSETDFVTFFYTLLSRNRKPFQNGSALKEKI